MVALSREDVIGAKLLRNAPLSQYEVAVLFGVSRQRIFEIEQRALAKIKRAILADREAKAVAVDYCGDQRVM